MSGGIFFRLILRRIVMVNISMEKHIFEFEFGGNFNQREIEFRDGVKSFQD